MRIEALSWNLFHGRDAPPDPALFTIRSRLLRTSERNATHLQVNRDLRAAFATVLSRAQWDVALLQECPPRWIESLASACDAEPHAVLTSRNSCAPVRALAARINPDLIASAEGGSNLTLVRGGTAVERRALVLRPGPRPERRTMAFTRIALSEGTSYCVANLHASAGRALREQAEEEVHLAAELALEWAAGAPLLLGGDLNLRPRDSRIYEQLEDRHGLRQPTAPGSLDHLLARGFEIVRPPAPWPLERREVRARGLAIRLSDHAPVDGAFSC
jgi:endonuclease/exonuclease/phosphatase family metal-dependent hydrolase